MDNEPAFRDLIETTLKLTERNIDRVWNVTSVVFAATPYVQDRRAVRICCVSDRSLRSRFARKPVQRSEFFYRKNSRDIFQTDQRQVIGEFLSFALLPRCNEVRAHIVRNERARPIEERLVPRN